MTAGYLPDRDRADIDALVADRYLDALLAAGDRRADDAPADAALDPDVRHAAATLRRALVRVHPSFRFEERLADRLVALAAGAAGGEVLAFPSPDRPGAPDPAGPGPDPLLASILAGELDPADNAILDIDGRLAAARRPLLVGGAITSAAISLVGVAWVAWRATRPAGRGAQAGATTRAAGAAHAIGPVEAATGVLRGLS